MTLLGHCTIWISCNTSLPSVFQSQIGYPVVVVVFVVVAVFVVVVVVAVVVA